MDAKLSFKFYRAALHYLHAFKESKDPFFLRMVFKYRKAMQERISDSA